MNEYPTPLAIALAFTEAWTSHDITTAAGYVAEDVVFDGPFLHSTSHKEYIDGLTAFAQNVTGMEVVAAFGDDQQALIMYNLSTGPFGTLTCAEHLTVRDGKIQTDKLAFDSYPIRKARAG